MISIEECKKHIGNLNLSDKEIEEIRDALYVLAENALDFREKTDTLCSPDTEKYEIGHQKNNKSPNLLQSFIRKTEKRRTRVG